MRSGAAWALAMVIAGCTSAPPSRAGCIAGASLACACSNGSSGAQLCLADGTLGACRCDGAPDAGFDDAADDAPAAQADGAPDVLRDASPDTARDAAVTPDVTVAPDVAVAPDITVAPDVATSLDVAPAPDVAPDTAPVDCRTAPCAAGSYCDLGDGRCRPGCVLDTDCMSSSRCDVATHRCACVPGYHLCGGACVSDTAAESCGASCSPCPTVEHGTATCVAGACGTTCEGGRLLCGGACLACGDPRGVASCVGGTCQVRCNAGLHLCGGHCYPNDDAAHCGDACAVCPTPPSASGVRSTCQAGVCETACATGSIVCDGVCQAVTTCTATRTRMMVEADARMIPHEMSLDARSAGAIHLVYRAPGASNPFESLRYWAAGRVLVVDPSNLAISAAIALHAAAPQGALFTTRGAGPQRVGYYALGAGGWDFNPFGGAAGLDTSVSGGSIAVSRDGDHAAFSMSSCRTADSVYYAERVGGAWTATRVGMGGCVAAVALASDGSPRIALWDPAESEGRSLGIMARGAGGVWTARSAVFPATNTYYASVAAGPTGQFAISYRNAMGYAFAAEANGWLPEVAAVATRINRTSLDIDNNGVARFTYDNGYAYGSGLSAGIWFWPRLCTRMGGRWTDEALPTINYAMSPYFGTLALSSTPAGRPVVAYQIPGQVGVFP